MKAGSLRRTTRTACTNDSRSGSTLAWSAASCISATAALSRFTRNPTAVPPPPFESAEIDDAGGGPDGKKKPFGGVSMFGAADDGLTKPGNDRKCAALPAQ